MSKIKIASQQDFLRFEHNKKIKVRIHQFGLFLFLLGFWEISASFNWINPFIFSSPSRILKCFCQMILDKSLFLHFGITLAETLISFLLVIFLSLFIAVLLWWNEMISRILEPYLVVLNSLPKSALAPILIVWLGNNRKTIIIAAISVAIFGSILNLYTGFCSVEPDKLKLIKTLKGNRIDCLKLVVLPNSVPLLLSIMKVNIGLSLVGVIIGEFLAARSGLGYLIIYGSQVFKLDWVMMSIVLLCIMAMGLYYFLTLIERLYLKQFK